MFCNINSREIRRNVSKRYAPPILSFYIHILRCQFPNETINKIYNLSTFFSIDHFINNLMNLVINGTHSEWWTEISYWNNWSNGDSVKIRLMRQSVVGQL